MVRTQKDSVACANGQNSEGFCHLPLVVMPAAAITSGGPPLFAWLIRHGWKYCSLIFYERKTLLNGWQIRQINSSEHSWHIRWRVMPAGAPAPWDMRSTPCVGNSTSSTTIEVGSNLPVLMCPLHRWRPRPVHPVHCKLARWWMMCDLCSDLRRRT